MEIEGLSDGLLLSRFIARREGAAFECLMRRHGPMVWGVCRRVLRDQHDAEDAFQATFLVLARRADSIEPREMVGNWLYGVAYRTAMKARASANKRRRGEERRVIEMSEPEAGPERIENDLLELLDAELSRLPDKYRVPIVLCELEGKSHKEAAGQLGWPVGTVSGRLSRARRILAARLLRRGLLLTVGALAMHLPRIAASAGVPASLVAPTAKIACLLAAGQAMATGLVSTKVAALTEGVAKTMLLGKIKGIAMALAVAITACLTPPAEARQHIYLFGQVSFKKDGIIEVQGGGIRVVNDKSHEYTEVCSDRIVLKKDGTFDVLGAGTMIMTKPSGPKRLIP